MSKRSTLFLHRFFNSYEGGGNSLYGVGGKSDLYNGVDAQTVFPHFSERDSFVELSFIKVFHGDGIVSSKNGCPESTQTCTFIERKVNGK